LLFSEFSASCPGQFSCLTVSQCIELDLLCDNVTHCEDGSDEMECGKLKYISHMYDNENWYFSNLSCINTLLIQRIFMFMTIHSTFNCYSELATKNSLLISTMTFSLSLCLLLSLYAYTYVHIPSSPFLCTNYIILPCHVSLSLIVSNLLLSICPLYL